MRKSINDIYPKELFGENRQNVDVNTILLDVLSRIDETDFLDNLSIVDGYGMRGYGNLWIVASENHRAIIAELAPKQFRFVAPEDRGGCDYETIFDAQYRACQYLGVKL